ncbi:MAG: LacI family DNA-binding transcriptional regulator [Acidimicrobiales bacterium]|jgi:DNA-binding LacI/PurR family transcriptional regulator
MTAPRGSVKGVREPATLEDVAREAGVSRALVSLVMRQKPQVSEERRARVLAAATRLGYRPNAMARSLASRRSNTVGVLLNDLHNPFFAEITDGIEQVARHRGYRILLSTGGRSRAREEAALEAFLESRVDGLVLVSTVLTEAQISQAARLTPVTLVSRTSKLPSVDSVLTDDVHGAELAVAYLIELGHRRIAHIDGGRNPGSQPRRRGYERAMDAAGLKRMVVPGDFSESSGAEAVGRLLALAELPTAVLTSNDMAAAGAMDRLTEAGFSVPADISVVGYDNTSLAQMRQVNLTTVNQPRVEMGRLAMQAVLERIEGSRTQAVSHVTTPTLVIRRSTGPVPG